MSRRWTQAFRVFYWVIGRLDPLIRPASNRLQIGYWLARRHILAVGRYYRIELADEALASG